VPYVLFAESHLAEPRRAWVRAAKHLLVPLAVRHAAAWLATGTLARRHLVHYGADPARIWTFANTVDVGVLAARAAELRPRRDEIRARLGLPAEGVVVLHAGRLLPVKAVDVLIEAAAHAGGVHLLIVGDGPERRALERAAARAGVGATFTGFLAEHDLVEAYVAADVFALLSRRETWGVVVNEAAACGLPLVLSHGVGAATDLLVAGVNGELVPVGDVDATASALHLLARDPERRRKQGLRSTEISASWGYGSTIESFGTAVGAALADAQETAARGRSK
jgi:glycosyltransferase involved in cell wall biosynthesis